MNRYLRISVLILAACGPDSTATLGSAPGDDESAELNGELTSSAAKTWWPTPEGSTWTFTSKTSTRTFKVDYADADMAFVSGLDLWVGYASSAPNTLYGWNASAGQWGAFIRFGYAVTEWSWAPTTGACGKLTGFRSATGVATPTPAGTFTDTRTISYATNPLPNVRCAAPELTSITFAPGVGPIAFTTGSGEAFVLKTAKVGTRTFPATSTGFKVAPDKTAYTNIHNSIVCITAPCPGNAETAIAKFTVTLTNTTSASKTYHFRSGQKFDLQLFDAGGKLVATWSADKMFTQALSAFTLAPGASTSFVGEMPLEANGAQLDGQYTVKATLTLAPEDGVRPTASASFSVKVQ